jgi:hypothetical protein
MFLFAVHAGAGVYGRPSLYIYVSENQHYLSPVIFLFAVHASAGVYGMPSPYLLIYLPPSFYLFASHAGAGVCGKRWRVRPKLSPAGLASPAGPGWPDPSPAGPPLSDLSPARPPRPDPFPAGSPQLDPSPARPIQTFRNASQTRMKLPPWQAFVIKEIRADAKCKGSEKWTPVDGPNKMIELTFKSNLKGTLKVKRLRKFGNRVVKEIVKSNFK